MTSPSRTVPRLDQHEHAARALLLIAQWQWLRATELGRLMYPSDLHSRKYAEKVVRKLLELQLLLARPLPGHQAGTAYVLSARGAAQLNAWSRDGGGYRSGKDWGTTQGGVWAPPASWRHDLIAAGVLSLALEWESIEVIPEAALRRIEPEAVKHPDGLLIDRARGYSYWVEVEAARKSGRNINDMVRALAKASRGEPLVNYDCVNDVPVRIGLVAVPTDARDERGYRLNHWHRVEAAIRRNGLRAPLQIVVAWVTLKGVGVGDISFEPKVLEP
jgi:hypothetical protein